MVQRHRHKQQRPNRPVRRTRESVPAEPPAPRVKTPRVVYGKPVVVLEDTTKNTFFFEQGAWVPFGASIAECRRDCLVQELPQKVNQMTRYEIRRPIAGAEQRLAMEEERSRDIDYAALAVKKALEEKFGRHNDLSALQVGADERTIIVRDGPNSAEGTRDDLLAGIRKSATYADVWGQWRG